MASIYKFSSRGEREPCSLLPTKKLISLYFSCVAGEEEERIHVTRRVFVFFPSLSYIHSAVKRNEQVISVSAVAPLVSTLWTVNNACVARFMNPFIFTGPSVSTKWRRGRRTDESKNRNEAPRDPRPQSPADFVTIDLSRVFMCVSVRVFLLRLLSDINCVSFSLSVPMDLGQGDSAWRRVLHATSFFIKFQRRALAVASGDDVPRPAAKHVRLQWSCAAAL